MLPESTTAITVIFLPALSAINGLGLRRGSGGCERGSNQPKVRKNRDGVGREGEEIVGWAAGNPTFGSGVGRRCRGTGGGSSGETSNRSVNSLREGMGVVLAL